MTWQERLEHDYQRGVLNRGDSVGLEDYILDAYGVSLASEYAGMPIRNPFGKASGQLSLNATQVARDRAAGLGFVVLKTVIAEDADGVQSMKAWAVPATHMKVEEIYGTREIENKYPGHDPSKGEKGWTVTWRGRGWSDSFAKYLELFDQSLAVTEQTSKAKCLVVPSVKFHLPRPGESEWRIGEYEYTIAKLLEVWRRHQAGDMPIEKDFSPTLAGDQNFSRDREQILEWLRRVPEIVRSTTSGNHVRLGLKLFNAAYSDSFQEEMLTLCGDQDDRGRSVRADYLIYGNRLFDPTRSYEGSVGVAYGGPDLSARNLEVLARWRASRQANPSATTHGGLSASPPLSATGNILTGKMAFEYLKLGATSFQMHTIFQLPDSEFAISGPSAGAVTRTERALHRLLFHPEHGFLAAVLREKAERMWRDGISILEISREFTQA